MRWELKTLRLDELIEFEKNPRTLSNDSYQQLKTSLERFGLIDKPIVNTDMIIIGGHQRVKTLLSLGEETCECWIPDRELTDEEVSELNIRLNKATGDWNWEILANQFPYEKLLDWGFEEKEVLHSDRKLIHEMKTISVAVPESRIESIYDRLASLKWLDGCKIRIVNGKTQRPPFSAAA